MASGFPVTFGIFLMGILIFAGDIEKDKKMQQVKITFERNGNEVLIHGYPALEGCKGICLVRFLLLLCSVAFVVAFAI